MIIGLWTRIEVFQIFAKRFTKFTVLKEKPSKGYMWSGERLTTIHVATRPENVWPEVWTKIGKAAQMIEKQEWAIGRPKLDNPRRLRGMPFIDPKDGEYREIIKKRQEKVGSSNGCGNAVRESNKETLPKISKIKHACIVEAHESTRQRLESSLPQDHQDHIAGKRIQFNDSLQLGSQVYFDASSDENSEAKAAVDKEWKKLETSPAWQLDKVRSKKEERDKKQVHFATFDGHLSSQKCGVTTKISEEKKVESYSEVTL